MDFFIRKGATSPILKLKMIDDGKTDKSVFNEMLENSIITFDMYDVKTNIPIILNEECLLSLVTTKFNNTTDEYYIKYQFTEEGTSIPGKYEGVVTIKLLDVDSNVSSKLIVPISEKLYINVI